MLLHGVSKAALRTKLKSLIKSFTTSLGEYTAIYNLTQLMSSLAPGSIRHTAHNNLQNLRNVYVKIITCKHIYS